MTDHLWRSLEEASAPPPGKILVQPEFSESETKLSRAVTRRQFLTYLSASVALAALNSCTRQPLEKIFPYAKSPEFLIPGKPLFFATALTLGGFARGVLVESHMGRPTKVEGNPDHPDSLGATDSFMQAAVLDLYDPDRSQVVLENGRFSTWNDFLLAMQKEADHFFQTKGRGLAILTETTTSPTFGRQMESFLKKYSEAAWYVDDAISESNRVDGSRLAFGEPLNTIYRFDQADIILSLDHDFLTTGPGSLRYAREFSSRRKIGPTKNQMNRLYAVEPSSSITGSIADHRIRMESAAVENFVRLLAAEMNLLPAAAESSTDHRKLVRALANDLKSHRGRAIVLVGSSLSPAAHALGHLMNETLGGSGQTVVTTGSVQIYPANPKNSLTDLCQAIDRGEIQTLLMLGGNPAFTASADLRFKDRMARIPKKIHLSLYPDETSALCEWHIPEAHELETWSDARAFDGTATICQPLIAPLYDGKSRYELLSLFLDAAGKSGHDVIKAHWQTQVKSDYETFWRESLHGGFVKESAFSAKRVTVDRSFLTGASQVSSLSSDQIEITFRPDPTIWDGRFANNGWLQELPKPLTKLT